MKTLDALVSGEGKRASSKRCRMLGCDRPSRAAVMVMVRRFKEGHHGAPHWDGSVSKTVSLCETHAVEVYDALIEAMP